MRLQQLPILLVTHRTASVVPRCTAPQAAAAAVAAAAEALEGLDLEGLDLDLDALNLDLLSNASKQEQAQVERALSLSQSLGGSRTLSLSSSLKDGGAMFGPLSPALSNKVQQVLLSPRASSQMQQLLLSPRAAGAQQGGAAAAAAALAAAANAAAGAGWALDPASEELPLEEMMTADIFGLE
jgi:hypothetical protein